MNVPRRRRGSSKSEDTESETLLLQGKGAGTSSSSNSKYSNPSSWTDEDNKENAMGRDRTSEFQSALRSLQGRAQTRQPNPMGISNSRTDRNLEQYSEFMKIAK
jgi:hypothetical protein